MKCPDCSKVLADDALSCRCGWSKGGEAGRPFVDCAHANCSLRAIAKIKTKTGWANLCEPHYVRYFDDLAHEGLAAKGLERLADETRAEHTARLRAWFRENARFKRGPDLEEAA